MRPCLFTIIALTLLACTPTPTPTKTADLIIQNVSIISVGYSDSDPADVVVRDGIIMQIGQSEERITDSTIIIDGTDRFLIPGLIDSHNHLNEIPGMTLEHEELYPEISAQARYQIPRSYLYHGFTTVIDLNSSPEVIDNWNAGVVRPQAYFCGASPVFDGYPMSFMPKPARYKVMPYFLFDESRGDEFPEGFDPELHTPSAVVGRIHGDGGICVKTHYEKGFGGRGDLPVPTQDLIKALVDAAHAKDLPVLMHANSEAAQEFGNGTGVDAFAHGMWTWNDRSATVLSDKITRIIDGSIAENIALQPTIQVLYGEQDIHNPDYLKDLRLKHVVPSDLISWYETEDGQWWRQRMLRIPMVAQLVEQGLWEELDAPPIARVSEALGYFATRGGTLLFGSDTPSDPTFANPPGLNGRIEMARWIEAGVSPEQVFYAATLGNAEFFGLADQIGTVSVGKRADLLLLRGNPMEGVSAYDSIEYVILGGEVHGRSSLSAAGPNNVNDGSPN